MALGAGRTGPLHRHGDDHLTDRRAVLGSVLPASPINESDSIQLPGNPDQSARITDSLGADGTHQTGIGDGRRIGRTQNGLPGERTLPAGIPHRLGSDTVSSAANFALKYIHFFHLATGQGPCQAKHAPLKAMEAPHAPTNPSDLRKSR